MVLGPGGGGGIELERVEWNALLAVQQGISQDVQALRREVAELREEVAELRGLSGQVCRIESNAASFEVRLRAVEIVQAQQSGAVGVSKVFVTLLVSGVGIVSGLVGALVGTLAK